MSNDDILCEAPGPGGRTCSLPYGHEPENVHAFEVELPHDLSHILEKIMTDAEAARVKYNKAYRRERIMFYAWCALCAVYLTLIIGKWVGQ